MEKNKIWETEFKDFLQAEPAQIPSVLTEQIIQSVQTELHPTYLKVLTKLILIQIVAGSASLLFCPQFSLSFSNSHGLMQYLMQYGMGVCMVGCGALFTGVSFLTASLILKPEEIRTLREQRLLQLTAISALSLGAFLCAGADVIGSMALLWALGAIIGGMITLELGWSIRLLSYHRGNT